MFITYNNFTCESSTISECLEYLKEKQFSNIQLISAYHVYRRRWNASGDNYKLFGAFLHLRHAEDFVETKRSRGSSWIIEIESRLLLQSPTEFILLDFEENFNLFNPFNSKKKIHLNPNFIDILKFIDHNSNWLDDTYGWQNIEVAIGQSDNFIPFEFYDLAAYNMIESDCLYSPFSHEPGREQVTLEWIPIDKTNRNESNNFKAFLWFQKSILNAHNIR